MTLKEFREKSLFRVGIKLIIPTPMNKFFSIDMWSDETSYYDTYQVDNFSPLILAGVGDGGKYIISFKFKVYLERKQK